MNDLTSQVLSLASMILIPFIPNDILRDIMLVLAPLFFVARLVHHNTPHRQVENLDASATDLQTLFSTAVDQCARDPCFVHETGWKLAEWVSIVGFALVVDRTFFRVNITVSTHLVAIMRAIGRCRRDMEDHNRSLRSSVHEGRRSERISGAGGQPWPARSSQQASHQTGRLRLIVIPVAFGQQQSLTQRRSRRYSNDEGYLRQVPVSDVA
ncbi:hypothetical protein C8R46DRAFT_1075102 [Mycena filopes]|nr:hypothetical protein C8R46DRAFT_1075102 [Mycena filopes]